MPELDLTAQEAAYELRVNVLTIQRYLRTGRLEGYRVGKLWRVPQESLSDFKKRSMGNISGTAAPDDRDQRLARIRAVRGSCARTGTSSAEFILRKQEEIDRENARWQS